VLKGVEKRRGISDSVYFGLERMFPLTGFLGVG